MPEYLGEETREVLSVFLSLAPAVFYALGIMRGASGRLFFLVGLVVHVLAMASRAAAIGNIPLSEKRDTISFAAFSAAVVYWVINSRQITVRKLPGGLDIVALPLVSLLVIVSAAQGTVGTVSPFMKTPWFYLHTFFFFLSYGFFAVSACLGVLYIYRALPDYESLQYRVSAYGWILYSFSLVAGSIWFFTAYGTYWLWTSRELWTTITWFFYGLYLHARLIAGLRGKVASALGVLGFAVAIFAYFGVGTVIPSPPTQF